MDRRPQWSPPGTHFHCSPADKSGTMIFTIATAALQEVDKQLQAEKAKIAQLQEQMKDSGHYGKIWFKLMVIVNLFVYSCLNGLIIKKK